MSFGFEQRWAAQQAARREEKRYRRHRTVTAVSGVQVTVDGHQCLNFASNDYLNMSQDAQVRSAFHTAADEFGVGSGASHLICGHSEPHAALEAELCEWTGKERALLFSSGYQANTALLQTLLQTGDYVFQDRLNHASLLDAGLASGARFRRYPHGDATALTRLLKKEPQTASSLGMVVTDGVFSMDGDLAPLAALSQAIGSESCPDRTLLMVDDAHGLGVIGPEGAGTLAHLGVTDTVPILMGTFGKALGTAGAFVAGSDNVIEMLTQHARPYIYTTALSPAMAAATLVSIRQVRQAEEKRSHIQNVIAQFSAFSAGFAAYGAQLLPSSTPIQALVLGSEARTLAVAEHMWARGFWVGAIRPPTVAVGASRLRIALSSGHSWAHIDQLVGALLESLASLPLDV